MAKLCRVDGCDKAPPPSAGGTLCGMHRHRLTRHGDVNIVKRPPGDGWTTWNGYHNVATHSHPLRRGGRVAEGRLVLYDKIGPGTHPCHWCHRPVEWGVNLRANRLNGDPADSNPANLVPACPACIFVRSTRGETRAGGRRDPLSQAFSRSHLGTIPTDGGL